MHHHVRLGGGHRPKREHRFIGCLGVQRVGGIGVRGAIGNPVAAGELGPGQHRLHVFGRAERRSTRLHVDVRGEATIDHGSPRPNELGQRQARQCLGVLLRQRPGEGDRSHGPGEGEGCHHDDLTGPRHLDDSCGHGRVEPEGRARVDDGEERRLLEEGVLRQSAGDAGDLDPVADAAPAQRIGVEDLVGEDHEVAQAHEVTNIRVDVDGLQRVAAHQVDDVEALGEAQQVPIVGEIARPSTAVEIGAIRRAADGAEIDAVVAEDEVVGGIAGMNPELRRRRGQRALDQAPIHPHPLPGWLDLGPRGAEDVPGFRQEDVEPDLLEDGERRLVDGLDLVRRDDQGWRLAVADGLPRQLGDGLGRALRPPRPPLRPPLATAARHPLVAHPASPGKRPIPMLAENERRANVQNSMPRSEKPARQSMSPARRHSPHRPPPGALPCRPAIPFSSRSASRG